MRQKSRKPLVQAVRDGFVNFSARMGIGADNVATESTYFFDLLSKNRLKLEAMYRSSWIVGVAVDSVAEDMTREGVEVTGSADPERIKLVQKQMSRLGIWDALLNTIKWARLYGGAVGFMVIDGQDPESPLDVGTVAKGQFKGLKVYDRWQLQPDMTRLVSGGMDDGLPAFYDVISDVSTGTVSRLRIHHSRCIRMVGIQLPAYQAVTEQWWGESVVERFYDRLVAFDAATMGAMNLLQRAHLRTVQIDGLREVLAAGGQAEENLLTMFHHMRMLQTTEGLTLLDKQDAFSSSAYSFAGISDVILQFGQQISGALGIPLVRLFGQSPAGLSSSGESDIRNYYDNVKSQQESRMREPMGVLLSVIYRSLFSEPPPSDLDFEFTSLWQQSDKEKADTCAVSTAAIAQAYDSGIISQATALLELKQSAVSTGIFSNISEEEIADAQYELPPVPGA